MGDRTALNSRLGVLVILGLPVVRGLQEGEGRRKSLRAICGDDPLGAEVIDPSKRKHFISQLNPHLNSILEMFLGIFFLRKGRVQRQS